MWEPGEEPSPQGVVVREGFLKEKVSCGEEKLARRHRPVGAATGVSMRSDEQW